MQEIRKYGGRLAWDIFSPQLTHVLIDERSYDRIWNMKCIRRRGLVVFDTMALKKFIEERKGEKTVWRSKNASARRTEMKDKKEEKIVNVMENKKKEEEEKVMKKVEKEVVNILEKKKNVVKKAMEKETKEEKTSKVAREEVDKETLILREKKEEKKEVKQVNDGKKEVEKEKGAEKKEEVEAEVEEREVLILNEKKKLEEMKQVKDEKFQEKDCVKILDEEETILNTKKRKREDKYFSELPPRKRRKLNLPEKKENNYSLDTAFCNIPDKPQTKSKSEKKSYSMAGKKSVQVNARKFSSLFSSPPEKKSLSPQTQIYESANKENEAKLQHSRQRKHPKPLNPQKTIKNPPQKKAHLKAEETRQKTEKSHSHLVKRFKNPNPNKNYILQ